VITLIFAKKQSCNGTTGICDVQPTLCDDNNPCTNDKCQTDGTCLYAPKTCDNSDPCNPQTCNGTNGNCDVIPVLCNDNNVCTNDSCVGTSGAPVCNFATYPCPNSDPCTPGVCNSTVGCLPGVSHCEDNNPCTEDVCIGPSTCNNTLIANVCDDANACTDDLCDSTGATLDAACTHKNTTCVAPSICQNVSGCNTTSGCTFIAAVCPPSADWCQVPICDDTVGCLLSPKPCIVKDPDCYVGNCDSLKQQCTQTALPNWESIPSSQKGVTCYAFYNKAKTAAIITAGVIAGVVVGAVVFAAVAAVAARKAYLYMQLRQGNIGAAQNNPLFAPPGGAGTNPLFT